MPRTCFLLCWLAAFLLAGCAPGIAPPVLVGPETGGTLLLPPPPARARVRYLYSVRTAHGLRPGELPFRSPMAVTETGPGRFAVLEQADSYILLLLTRGPGAEKTETKIKIIEPAAPGTSFSSLVDDAAAPDGTLYFTDSALKKVFYLRKGSRDAKVFAPGHKFERPTGIAYDPVNGRIYVVDTLAHKVFAFDAAGKNKKILEWGGRGTADGKFNYPTYITAGPRGDIYVSDTMNFRVQSFTPRGKFRFSLGGLGLGAGEFSDPKGVAVSPDGIVYVADARRDLVEAFSSEGRYLFYFGSSGAAPGQFWQPSGIYVDKGGRIYACDYLNGRVQVFEPVEEKKKR